MRRGKGKLSLLHCLKPNYKHIPKRDLESRRVSEVRDDEGEYKNILQASRIRIVDLYHLTRWWQGKTENLKESKSLSKQFKLIKYEEAKDFFTRTGKGHVQEW